MITANSWLFLIVGFVIGGLVAYVLSTARGRTSSENEGEVGKLKEELDTYREEVSEHFVKTADLVNNLTHAYKAVYDHLESGAYRLVGEETLDKRLEGVESEPVMLEYIGQRKAINEGTTSEHAADHALKKSDAGPEAITETRAPHATTEAEGGPRASFEESTAKEPLSDAEAKAKEARTASHAN